MIFMPDSPGAKINYLRRLTGMSQEELGRRVGLQRAAINKYEKGTVENIPIKTIEKIAKVFDVSPTFIVGWKDTNSNSLSAETKVIEGVQRFYGKDAVEILEIYTTLNIVGKRRIRQYCRDMDMVYHGEDEDILV
jgi:transcriptional regulator with XRE-family HTH domain